MKGFSIAGIGTDVGKTVVSAILAEALGAHYFKPVQAGDIDNSDSIKIKSWCSDRVQVAEETFKLLEPMAPHAAAAREGITLSLDSIEFPKTQQPLILEGAGGVLVPLNEKGETFLDIYEKAQLPVIVISRHYLGSINHTLLTVEALKSRGLTIAGIIFVGAENKETEAIIEKLTKLNTLGRVVLSETIDADFIQQNARSFKHLVYEL